MLRSGKVVTTTAIGVDAPEDQMTARLRDLRSSDEVDQSSMPEQGKIQAPDLSLSGKIIQRNLSINSRNTQVEYYLQLTLTDVSSGLAIWEDEVQIIKRGSSRTPTW